MTEYDAFAIYREQEKKNEVSAMECHKGIITYYFKDGTTEQYKKNWLGKLCKTKRREES